MPSLVDDSTPFAFKAWGVDLGQDLGFGEVSAGADDNRCLAQVAEPDWDGWGELASLSGCYRRRMP